MNGFQKTVKYLFDRIAALIGLLFLGWLLLIIALVVKIKMPDGPVLFTQTRVGRKGKLFKIHKFRTMSNREQRYTIAYPNKDQVTPLGAKLRHYKLDELPELWDVLVGNMSFVGPRPDVPGYADKLQGEDRVVLEMRPGITGPATLKYRNEEKLIEDYVHQQKASGDPRSEDEIALWYNDEVIYPDKVRINLEYYRHHSFRGDLRYILETILG